LGTGEVLDAARSGDAALVSMLLAEEVDVEPAELAALVGCRSRKRRRAVHGNGSPHAAWSLIYR
jgi:hypothetical protein